MQKYILCLVSVLIAGCASSEHHTEIFGAHIKRGDCKAAENYGRNNAANNGEHYLALGLVYIECYRKRKEGVEYLKVAVQNGNKNAVDALIKLGEKPPEPPKVIYKERIVQQPQPQPQQIIIQQQAPAMNQNLGACIQDGGGLFCPNHPSTRRR